ncbi:carbohydrate sulfotransferase 9-like [Protopterus annectens]|uniref:carbohydrate sulfotransferase 9-like n=1 Tax=Protopterus annectens TaxID=7888 RepID=UPI001CFA7E39|nr:carbohydrate sulfotransferase 9-like [Protopterus annectens]
MQQLNQVEEFKNLWVLFMAEDNGLDGLQDWLSTQKQHKRSLYGICNRHNLRTSIQFNKLLLSTLLVEHTHRFIYCSVPKVGCSNWKRTILQLSMNISGRDPGEFSQKNIHRSILIKNLTSYSLQKQLFLLQNYTKIMFSRNPLERLVSAYRDKFLHENDYYSTTVANKIKRKYRHKSNDNSTVTFKEFIRYVVEENNNDIHWMPMFQLCQPCSIEYDFIGRHESMTEDADNILKYLGVPKHVHFPDYKKHSNEGRTTLNITETFLQHFTKNEIDQIYHKYKTDFLIFNYSYA